MIRFAIVTTLVVVSLSVFSCQSKESKPQKEEKPNSFENNVEQQEEQPDTIFTFTDGSQLAITGYSEMIEGRKLYSEFNLTKYKLNELIEGWSAVKQCEISFSNDTLKVNQLGLFAIGKGNEFETHIWKLNQYFKVGNEIEQSTDFNEKLKLGKVEIESALKEFETTEWQTQIQSNAEYTEAKMNLANRLMLAAISGNEKAAEYFKEFKTKFKPDGANAEWYSEMKAIFEFAESKS